MHSISNNFDTTMQGFAPDLLEGRTLLVTGAGKGIGEACVHALAACGANIIAVARTAEDLNRLRSTHGSQVEPWALDVTSDELIERISALEHLDGLVNNAGTNRVGEMASQTSEDFDAVMDLNVRALWRVSRSARGPLERAGQSSIVNMSSQMAHVGSPQRTLYCMSKHAVEGLTKAMAVELANKSIRVNTVAPTFVLTPLTEPMMANPEFSDFVYSMIPGRQLATVEQVAAAVVFLISHLSASTTGSCLKVDGGWTAH